jgi:hypothetical protein
LHTQFIVSNDALFAIESMSRSPGDHFPKLVEKATGLPYTRWYSHAWLVNHHQSINKEVLLKHQQGRHLVVRQSVGWDTIHYAKGYVPKPIGGKGDYDFIRTCSHDSMIASLPTGKWGIAFSTGSRLTYDDYSRRFWQ